jgi:hypothetical protein
MHTIPFSFLLKATTLTNMGAVLDNNNLALIGHVVYVGVVNFSLVRDIVCDGHGHRV